MSIFIKRRVHRSSLGRINYRQISKNEGIKGLQSHKPIFEQLETRALLAATLTRFDSPEGSSAFVNEFVRMDLGDFKVDIDTRFGGTPSRWYNNFESQSVINPFAGEGVTVMWDQGNDPTQGSANGPGLNPIARLDGQQMGFNYYGRETQFDTGVGNAVAYEVTGFAPFFWISHEAGDDAIPSESMSRWRTLYNNPGDPNDILSDPTVPIFYQSNGVTDGAVLFIGDSVAPIGLPWHQRLAEMREGRFAAKVRVSLQNASSDAIAGLMFRRQLPSGANVSEADAYFAPGYSLNVNKAGTLQIVRVAHQGASPVPVWTASGVATSSINSANGSLLELRSHNGNGNIEIWLNNVKVGDFNDPLVIRGSHFGLFAQSTSGSIKFSDRQVFDVGTEYVARYSGSLNGVLTTDIRIRNAEGVSTANQVYFAQMPVAWLGLDFRADAYAAMFDSTGQIIVDSRNSGPGAYQRPILRGGDGNPATPEPYALWLGSQASQKGILGVPRAAWVNDVPANHPHAQIDVNNQGFFAVSLNPLPAYASWPPPSQSFRNAVTSLRLISDWRPRLEPISPLLVSISDETVIEVNTSGHLVEFTVSLNKLPTQMVSVNYQTYSGSATAGSDFVPTSGTLVFDPADAVLSKTVLVPIVSDLVAEGPESFSVALSSPSNAGIGKAIGIGTIIDDDSIATITDSFVYYTGFAGGGSSIDMVKVLAREEPSPQVLNYNNLTNNSTGITGLVFDIANLPTHPTASDFQFQMSPQGAFVEGNHPPASWETAPTPSSITVIPGSTPRVLIHWPDHSISNRWLRIGILANENTGLFEPEYYYIGHLMGETTGPTAGVYTVNFNDITGIRASVGQTVTASSLFDIDKNGTVTFSDISAMRSSIGTQLTNITVSSAGSVGMPSLSSLPGPGGYTAQVSLQPGLGSDMAVVAGIPLRGNSSLYEDFEAIKHREAICSSRRQEFTIWTQATAGVEYSEGVRRQWKSPQIDSQYGLSLSQNRAEIALNQSFELGHPLSEESRIDTIDQFFDQLGDD